MMSTTTVRLDNEDEQLLDKLALSFGGRSNAIRLALRNLGQDFDRNEALGVFLAEWQSDAGEVNEADVAAMTRRYQL
jgi:Arc/MetJ-type ribon-helix-helix transcriptional regulator